MKKIALILITVALTTAPTLSSFADIQAPPGSRQTAIHKLSRSVANIVYGITEIPSTMDRALTVDGSSGFAEGVVGGSTRTLVRLGFGAYEFVTFPFKTYKGSYRSPLRPSIWFNSMNGYSELPPEIGFQSKFDYTRAQNH